MRPGTLGGPGLPDRVRIGECQVRSNYITERDRWGHFISKAESAGDELMNEIANNLEDRAKAKVRVRTGKLRNSIHGLVTTIGGRKAAVLIVGQGYGKIIEHGSRPHLIHGVRAQFPWRGGWFVPADFRYGPVGTGKAYENWTKAYGATVRHPGTRPYPFIEPAYTRTWAEARATMRKVYGKVR